MKKILVFILILCLINNINSIENQKPEHRSNEEQNVGSLTILPAEIRHKVIKSILEDHINQWNNIFNFDKDSLKAELDRLSLISKDFIVFQEQELENYITKLKYARFAYLQEIIKKNCEGFSKEELNQKVIKLLDKGFWKKENAEETVRLIIAGADSNLQDKYGTTALIDAASRGHTEIVNLLINNNADVNLQDKNGATALMKAARNVQTKTVKLLKSKSNAQEQALCLIS